MGLTSGEDDDVLAATLLQIAQHADHLATIDTRLEAVTTILGRHASVVNALDGLDGQVASVASQLADLTARSASQGFPLDPAPRWWNLADADRQTAVGKLRAWVEQIYRPGYGHLAATLPTCWEPHPLCLYTLDRLSDLWSVLYLDPQRTGGTLGAQAEWHTRLLPAAASQMAHEATGCRHAPGGPHPPQSPAGPFPGR